MKRELLARFYAQYRSVVFPAIVALSSLFLIVFAIYPQTVQLIQNRKTASDLINKSKFLETKVAALESYDEEDLSRKVTLVLGVYPADKDFGNILGLLQEKTSQFGFNITSLSLGNIGSKLGSSESYIVKMEVEGTKVLLPVLLNNLEDSSRLMRISTIDISSSQVSQALTVNLVVEVLYSKLPQAFGTADSPLPEITQKDDQAIVILAELSRISTPATASSSLRGKPNPFE